jgi:hypothetical protein
MDAFDFKNEGDFFKLSIHNNNVSFTPKRTKAIAKLLGADYKTAKFKLNKPDEISLWFQTIGDKIGPDKLILEIYKLKCQLLEDFIPKITKQKAFEPDLFDKNYYRNTANEWTIMNYFENVKVDDNGDSYIED